jgi:hypothetical protein
MVAIEMQKVTIAAATATHVRNRIGTAGARPPTIPMPARQSGPSAASQSDVVTMRASRKG